MCLTTKQKKAKISIRKIVCYKIVEIVQNGTEIEYRSPYTDFLIGKGSIEGTSVSCRSQRTVKVKSVTHDFTLIGGGMIHACTSIEKATNRAVNLGGIIPRSRYAIFECEIPAFTRHYVLLDNTEIAAKKIKFIKNIGIKCA